MPGVSHDDAGPDAALARHELGTAPRKGPLLGVLGTLVVSNVMANQVLPSWAYVPWNCGVAVVLVVIATRFDGASANDLGLAPRRVPDGLRWGAAVSAGLLAIYLIGLAIPETRGLFEDERADVGALDMLWRTLVLIPFGTVLMEEVAFRGVLPAMFRRRLGDSGTAALRADVFAALLFGLWHVLPSLDLNEANPVFRDLLPGPIGQALTVAGGVLATGVAGMGLSWLRNRSGSLVAPAMLHCSTNSLGYVLAWFVQRG